MDHPLMREDQVDLRKRVVSILKSSLSADRDSPIVFVCGGNDPSHMRQKFKEYCKEVRAGLLLFEPESAIPQLLITDNNDPFDIVEFESTISNISSVVVIFPEAAGSFAETGYFSAIKEIAKKCLLVLDSQYQSGFSFISQGPAAAIERYSIFSSRIQLDYANPRFSDVVDRISTATRGTYKKRLNLDSIANIRDTELLVLVYAIADVLGLCTRDDILFILKAIFRGNIRGRHVGRVHTIISILVGAGYLLPHGEFGHLAPNLDQRVKYDIAKGSIRKWNEVRTSILGLIQKSDQEFADLFYESRNVS